MSNIKFTTLDIRTGETCEHIENDLLLNRWIDGNNSCDCNRRHPHLDEDDYDLDNGICDGNTRFLVVDVNPYPKGILFEEFNRDYPEQLQNLAYLWYLGEATQEVLAQYTKAGWFLTRELPVETD